MTTDDLAPKSSRFLALASICVVVAALYFARDVMVPLAVAVLLSFLLAPLVHRVERMHLPRVAAVLLVVAFSFAIIGTVGWLITNQVTAFAERLGDYQGDIEHKIQSLRSSFGHGAFAKATQTLTNVAREVATSQPSDGSAPPRGTSANPVIVEVTSPTVTTANAFKVIGDALAILAPVGQAFIVVIFVIFMLIQREDLRDRLIRLIGHGQLTVTTQALDDAGQRVSRYLLAQSMINGSIGIVIGIGLAVLHIPNAPLWGLLCALLRFIPYLGIWIGAIFPIILSFAIPEGSFAFRPLVTIIMFVVIELAAANVAEPLLYGSTTGVSSLAILVSAVFWTWLWGGIGLLLATPLTVVLAVLGKYVPQMHFLTVLLGDEPVLKPYERYYQRLLADDPEEAEELLEEFGKTKPDDVLFSDVMLPALQTAERDFRRGMLDDARRDIIRQAMQEHIEGRRLELIESKAKEAQRTNAATPDTEPTDKGKQEKETDEKSAQPKISSAFLVPRGCTISILCLPANDQADETASAMVSHLLEGQNYCARFLTTDALASEMVESVDEHKADVVVISALPPGAAAHARYLCKRLHAKHPDIQMLVGLWGFNGDLSKANARISCAGNVRVSNNFSDGLNQIHQMVQPLLLRQQGDAPHPAAAS